MLCPFCLYRQYYIDYDYDYDHVRRSKRKKGVLSSRGCLCVCVCVTTLISCLKGPVSLCLDAKRKENGGNRGCPILAEGFVGVVWGEDGNKMKKKRGGVCVAWSHMAGAACMEEL